MDTVIEWLEGYPLYGDGLSFEIRQLVEQVEDKQAKGFIVDQIVLGREKLKQEGKLRKDEDGSTWMKVEIEDEKLKGEVEERE